ncbi:homoserine O-acetyltransferase [Granulicella aggregans]|uniref:Homoserine O-acetyltransferase n=1 Tax=Granulicella aggregans TaxID=474949 RepID=A0A7W7ZA29_9BACT|nr:alpha/beta fold hydrolase [Granulicella aggregans]MBB5055947.1 homoserine O-acetyltransferase [Granulicella aggregans]
MTTIRKFVLAAATVWATMASITPAFCSAIQDGELKIAELGTCKLASGKVILDCRVGYRTYGRLDAAKDNAVIMPSWLNGRSEDLSSLFGAMPSPKRLVDTSRFFCIAFDAFGDGISSSPSNSRQQAAINFPEFNMEDMARAQYRVVTEVLGIKHLHAAIGLSMGAHQVFAWTTLYPNFIDLAVPIVGSPQVTPFDLLSKQIAIDAIESDPGYQGGKYTVEPQLKLANAVGALIVSAPGYRNEQTTREKFPQWLGELEAPQRQDANDRVWQLKAILAHDILHGKTIAEVARATPVKFLIIVAAEDRMVTPQPALDWAKAARAETYVSPGTCAHLIMNCDAEAVSERVQRFLAQ